MIDLLAANGLKTVTWNLSFADWRDQQAPQQIVSRVKLALETSEPNLLKKASIREKFRKGSPSSSHLILMHETIQLAALEEVLRLLSPRQIVGIDQCLKEEKIVQQSSEEEENRSLVFMFSFLLLALLMFK